MKKLLLGLTLLSSLASYAACNLTISKGEEVLIDKVLMGAQTRIINEKRNHTIENRWLAE